MKFIAKIIWFITYIPAGMALFFTMCIGIGIILLVVDFASLLIAIFKGVPFFTVIEFPPGFISGLYLCFGIRMWIAEVYDWDITEFTIE